MKAQLGSGELNERERREREREREREDRETQREREREREERERDTERERERERERQRQRQRQRQREREREREKRREREREREMRDTERERERERERWERERERDRERERERVQSLLFLKQSDWITLVYWRAPCRERMKEVRTRNALKTRGKERGKIWSGKDLMVYKETEQRYSYSKCWVIWTIGNLAVPVLQSSMTVQYVHLAIEMCLNVVEIVLYHL